MGIFKFFKKVLNFEKAHLKYIFSLVKKDPERLLIGAIDPFSTKLWNTILGQNYEPLVGQFGQATEGAYQYAEARGIDTGPGRALQGVATLIAAFYAGQYGMSKLSAAGTAPAASTPGVGGGAGTSGASLPASASAAPASVTSGGAVFGPGQSIGSVAGGGGGGSAASTFGSKVGGLFRGIGKIGSKVGGFVKNNPEISALAISSIGQGLLSDAQLKAERDLFRERYGHYSGTDPGRNFRSLADPSQSGSAPNQQSSSAVIAREYGGFEYQYDPRVGRIIRVPLA